MLSLLKEYKGPVEINGVSYSSISDAIAKFPGDTDNIIIKLPKVIDIAPVVTTEDRPTCVEKPTNFIADDEPRRITVRQYMTKKSTPEFTFMKDFNGDVPMPLRTMVGTIEDRINRRVYMKLHGDITQEKTQRCIACGRIISNPVSQYFGLGPECGGHGYINPFYSEEELKAAVAECRKKLQNITWEGWVPLSAIIEEERV